MKTRVRCRFYYCILIQKSLSNQMSETLPACPFLATSTRKSIFSSDLLVRAELLPPKGSNIQTGAGNCNVVHKSDFSKEFRSSHSSRTEVTGLRRWVGKRKFLAGSPFVARSQPKRRTHPKAIFGCENSFHFAGRHAPIYT